MLTTCSSLVLAHGIRNDVYCRQEAESFWATQCAELPKALLTSFPLLVDNGDWGDGGFLGRAQSLLVEIQEDRRRWASSGEVRLSTSALDLYGRN